MLSSGFIAGLAAGQDRQTTTQSTGFCAQTGALKPQNKTAPPLSKEETPAKLQKDLTPPTSVEKSAVELEDGSASLLLKELSEKATTERSTGQDDGKLSKEMEPAKAPVIVVGFVGGFVGHGNMAHNPVQIAARLRDGHPTGVSIKVFENRRRKDAHREILSLLDTNHGGKLSAEEKQQARIILYGVSWGGSAAVALARELEKEGIPVLLTVQVDSVAKMGQNDEVIPANVGEAANFFQTDGLLHGKRRIRAADATHTKILGNFRMEYKTKSVRCEKFPWYDSVFMKYHTEIECDPAVWDQVESLIRAKLPPTEQRQVANLEEKSEKSKEE